MNASVRQGASAVARRLASALIGRAVTVNVGDGTVEGIVSEVIVEAGLPKVIVCGGEYSLGQILTAAPRELAMLPSSPGSPA